MVPRQQDEIKYMLCRQMYTVLCYLTQFLLNAAHMFLAYIRLIFRGSITSAILLVYKILKMPLDVPGYWYLKTILKRP
jgi:hypothetical protein